MPAQVLFAVGEDTCSSDVFDWGDPHSHLKGSEDWTHTGTAYPIDVNDGLYKVTVPPNRRICFTRLRALLRVCLLPRGCRGKRLPFSDGCQGLLLSLEANRNRWNTTVLLAGPHQAPLSGCHPILLKFTPHPHPPSCTVCLNR